MSKLKKWLSDKPGVMDAFVLTLVTILITWHPFYLYGPINYFEMGLYLPGIDAILHGQIPYKDFFHLRGPLELYVPAWWMTLTGRNFAVMPTYFYLGTLATLIILILIAKEIFRSRFFIYVMTFAFLSRTFPRVSFTIGGGFRFAWGVAAVYCAIRYFKSKTNTWLLLAGIFSAVALMTSVDVGIFAFSSILISLWAESLFYRRAGFPWGSTGIYSLGAALILIPLGIFLQNHGGLILMLDAYYQTAFNMLKAFPQLDPVPHGFMEVLVTMVNPTNHNFQRLTPFFCYIGIAVILIDWKNKRLSYPGVLCLAVYGLLLFIASMRSLWGPAFETALQPEKLLLFFLLEQVWLWLNKNPQRFRQTMAVVLLVSVFISTFVYAIPRFQKRFYTMQVLLGGKEKTQDDLVALNLLGMNGMVVPLQQEQDIRQMVWFMQKYTRPQDRVVFFPDFGIYHFIVQRPFVGKFPVVSLSWICSQWHKEFMQALRLQKPVYVVTYKKLPAYIPKTQLIVHSNKAKYDEFLTYLNSFYHIVSSTPSFNIWHLKP